MGPTNPLLGTSKDSGASPAAIAAILKAIMDLTRQYLVSIGEPIRDENTPVLISGLKPDNTIGLFSFDADGKLKVAATTSIDKSGLATETKQDAEITAINAIATLLSGQATAANQIDIEAVLGSILSKLSADPSTGAKQDVAKLVLDDILAALGNLATSAKQPNLINGDVPVILRASGTAGWTAKSFRMAANENLTTVKAGVSKLGNETLINKGSALAYIHYFDLAVAPTTGSATGWKYSKPIPANASGAGLQCNDGVGVDFTNGIAFKVTLSPDPVATTALASADDVMVTLYYV